jgi:hypothetical protein
MKSIADVVSASGLAGYAEVALILFFAVFVVVGLRVMAANKDTLDHTASLPLEDGEPLTLHDSLISSPDHRGN